jgi:hypothetical protein
MERNMDRGSLFFQMEINMKVIIFKINEMESEFILGPRVEASI